MNTWHRDAKAGELVHLEELRSAADQGDRIAQLNLGMTLLRGNTESLVCEGLNLIERAAFKQHPLALHSHPEQ